MRTMRKKWLMLCIIVSGFVVLTASPAEAATVLYQSANTVIYLGEPYTSLEFENPLAGTEMIKEYAVKEWMDADYDAGPPRWYDDWSVNDPLGIDGYANEIWMRRRDHSIWTSTTVPSSAVSIHLNGDNNDGLADILVDGILVARLDMGSTLAQTALIIVKNLANITHHIQVNDRGIGTTIFGDDVATMGAAALEKRIKWSQPPIPIEPDNLYYGWNEISIYDSNQIVADDWECVNDDPITDIHWWGSFRNWNDSEPPLMPTSFHITIWTDVPNPSPGDPDTFSHPNEVVWEIDCYNFTSNFVGWDYDPRTKCYEACFYFEQFLTEAEYFHQRTNPDGTPNIYWISIAAQYPDGTIVDHPWGWKTRPRNPLSPAPDDAVIIRKPTMPHIGDRYQDGKPIYWPDPNKSWDMAFELTARQIEEYAKWSQPPKYNPQGGTCYYGWDEFSQFASTRHIVADDWVCSTNDPVKDIHWWGSYIGWNDENPPIDAPDRFHIGVWTDVPAGIDDPFSHPGQMIWEWVVPRSALFENYDGCDEHPLIPATGESCFYYEFKIPEGEWFYQEFDPAGNPTIYWLSISAIYVNDPIYPWGWKTRLRDPDSQAPDDAVRIFDPTAPIIGDPYRIGEPIWWPDEAVSWDTAFELTSTRYGDVYTKWSQPPEPYRPEAYDGWNELSVYNWNQIAADDWYCDTDDPVTDIHWWGSYIRWSCEEPPEIPESFHIAIWTDVPAGADPNPDILYSHPGKVIWETDCYNFTSEFVGWDIDPRDRFAPPETCYKFSQDLKEEEWFKQKPGGNIYWISIAAKYPAGTTVDHPWGWKTRLRDLNSRAPDDAVRIFDPTSPILGSMYFDGYPIYWPTEDVSWDLAFELTTKEKPPKQPVPHLKWSQPPIEINQDSTGTSYKLYATTFQFVDQLLSVNPSTGNGTLIGNMSTLTPFGLSDRGTYLYTFDAFDSNSIVRIDPATGNTLQKIVIDPPGITGEGALAFRSDGTGYLTSAFGNAGQLWSFDITVPGSTYIGAVTPSMDGMDFNRSGVLYAIDQGSFVAALPYDLYTINQATGATTLVGSTGVLSGTGGVAGLTFAPDGTLFAALNDSLYTVNPGTGAATLVGPIGFSGVCGLTALPVATVSTLPVYCGWDEPSYLYEPPGAPPLMKVVADDYLCIGSMPVTSLHWWGSYIDWDLPDPPMQQPDSWQITFWSNVPAGIGAHYSYPEESLHQFRVPNDRVKVEMVGRDEFPLNPDIFPETCFQYYVDLNRYEIFWQNDYIDKTMDNTFWVSIVALYHNSEDVPNPWGWKTRPWSWSDDAVTFNIDDPPPIGDPIILDPAMIRPLEYQGESYDVAFELDTDPNYIKWEQPFTGIRNWPHYEDEKSMARVVTTTENVIKWAQQPDLSDLGIDVDATLEMMVCPQILADDFNCISTETIDDIHVYGSWLHDEPPNGDPLMVDFTLSIHEDLPIGDPRNPHPWSMPGDILWSEQFFAADFTVDPIPAMAPESYYIRCIDQYFPDDHMGVWKYNFLPRDPFLQQGTNDNPIIYWLGVQAQPLSTNPDTRFGWKTRDFHNDGHFNDDATWVVGVAPYNGPDWRELLYPPGHPLGGLSMDLAFELTTDRVTTEFVFDRLVADDWLCERKTPVTAAVWWGSYIGYTYQACQDTTIAKPPKPDYFLLNIWTDVPAIPPPGPFMFSHPNEIIWEYRAYDYDEVLVGFDKHPYGQTTVPREPVFRYSVRLPEDDWFLQKDVNDVYWFSVVAVYESGTDPLYDWGWTNHSHVFNDDAVAGVLDLAAGVWSWKELFDQLGNSEDMSFMLFTEPGCFPATHSDYFEWLSVGKPDCWCCPRQCHGNATPTCEPPEGSSKAGYWYVGLNDLNILVSAWKILEPAVFPTPSGPGVVSVPNGICADFDHAKEGSIKAGYWRVGLNDLNILVANWKVLESAIAPTPSGPGVPADCLD